MTWEWLASLQSVVELIGSLIPRRVKIAPTHRGIRYRGMTEVSVVQPGVIWYWPFRSEVQVKMVVERPIALASQYLLTKDGKPVLVDGSILYSNHLDDNNLLKAFVETDSIEEVAASVAMACINEMIEASTMAELYDRQMFNRKLRKLLRARLGAYGLKLHRGNIETLSTGFPLLAMGIGR